MHICFLVTRGDSIGGAQIHVRDMALALHRDGHQVTVLTGAAGDMTSQLEAGGVGWKLVSFLVRPIRPVQDLKAVLATARMLRRLKPDLLSCHTAKAGMVGRLAAFLAWVPSIFTAHGWQFADGIPAGQARAVLGIERIVAPLCRKIITVSHYDYDLALRKKAVRAGKMVTIHNGLPWRDTPSTSGALPEAEAPCRLLMVARFQEQKDHETLLKALAGLTDLNWRLELVGDGPGMDLTREQAGVLGIADRVEFSGQRLDVPERMERADIYLLISNWEGFPRSIVEAMRASLPVIASDVGGCNESVAEGETGFLVPRGDVGVLRERLLRLISKPEERRKMGMAGRARYEKEFTFRRMYERTLEVYREVLDQ
jgi:glycosyltransferase involved in cell wall biosynthesis